MTKYDCNKVKDYVHEVKRMCNFHDGCASCPLSKEILNDCNSLDQITPRAIGLVQKWSDENPEKAKLTKEEKIFIECITDKGTTIYRCDNETLYLQNAWDNDYVICIKPTLFPFIEDGEEMSIATLLKYEVKED